MQSHLAYFFVSNCCLSVCSVWWCSDDVIDGWCGGLNEWRVTSRDCWTVTTELSEANSRVTNWRSEAQFIQMTWIKASPSNFHWRHFEASFVPFLNSLVSIINWNVIALFFPRTLYQLSVQFIYHRLAWLLAITFNLTSWLWRKSRTPAFVSLFFRHRKCFFMYLGDIFKTQ